MCVPASSHHHWGCGHSCCHWSKQQSHYRAFTQQDHKVWDKCERPIGQRKRVSLWIVVNNGLCGERDCVERGVNNRRIEKWSQSASLTIQMKMMKPVQQLPLFKWYTQSLTFSQPLIFFIRLYHLLPATSHLLSSFSWSNFCSMLHVSTSQIQT